MADENAAYITSESSFALLVMQITQFEKSVALFRRHRQERSALGRLSTLGRLAHGC